MWHKLTPLFSKTAFDRIALINNHWSHFSLIQQIESGSYSLPVVKNVSKIENYYNNFKSPATNKIVKIMEFNGPTTFYPLVEKGVNVHAYNKGEYYDTSSQAQPDNIFDFRNNNSYFDKRIHGMDNKAYENPREFESKIFSALSPQNYIAGIVSLEELIQNNSINLSFKQISNIKIALKELKDTCQDIKAHQIAWAKNLHYFPDKYIPPLRVPENFSTQDLNLHSKLELAKSMEKMEKISCYLFKKQIPENDYKKALELFEDSFIQNLLNNI